MNQFTIDHSSTSVVLRVKLDVAGLTEASAGLVISTITDNEASVTRYRASSSEIETISALGTYAAPTSGKCRFKEVDATNLPRVYELQLADARFAVSSAKRLRICFTGAGINAAGIEATVDLARHNANVTGWNGTTPSNLQSGRVDAYVGAEASGVTSAAALAVWNIDSETAFTSNSMGDNSATADLQVIANVNATISSRMASYTQPTGFLAATFPTTVASPTNITAGTITTVTNLTNLPAITNNWLTAAGITDGALTAAKFAASSLNGKGDWLLSSSYTAPLTAATTRAALGMASANMDTQLAAIQSAITTLGLVATLTNNVTEDGTMLVTEGTTYGSGMATAHPFVVSKDYSGYDSVTCEIWRENDDGTPTTAATATLLKSIPATVNSSTSISLSWTATFLAAIRYSGNPAFELVRYHLYATEGSNDETIQKGFVYVSRGSAA